MLWPVSTNLKWIHGLSLLYVVEINGSNWKVMVLCGHYVKIWSNNALLLPNFGMNQDCMPIYDEFKFMRMILIERGGERSSKVNRYQIVKLKLYTNHKTYNNDDIYAIQQRAFSSIVAMTVIWGLYFLKYLGALVMITNFIFFFVLCIF